MRDVLKTMLSGRDCVKSACCRSLIKVIVLSIACLPMAAVEAQTDTAKDERKKVSMNGVSFDTSFLPKDRAEQIDLKRFQDGNGAVPPGTYRSNIAVNGELRGQENLVFRDIPDHQDTSACISRSYAEETLNINLAKAEKDAAAAGKAGSAGDCIETALIGKVIPGASAQYVIGKQQLNLSIPQLYQKRSARGSVSPELWDAGIPAAMLNYDANTSYSRHDYGSSSQGRRNTYLGLNTRLNLGDWRLRHQSSIRWSDGQGRRTQTIAAYGQRALPSWRSQLTLGDYYTRGDIIDSISFRGIGLTTDDRMLPDSLLGYAPTISGVADTNARVTVTQNGYVIHQDTVAPGPFEIGDLSTGGSGDIEVKIEEADGRIKTFIIPHSSVPLLVRKNYSRYELTAGRLRNSGLSHLPYFAQGTYHYGFTDQLTGYVGALIAEDYHSGVGGVAFSTPFGAFSSDLGFARANLTGLEHRSGTNARVQYSKLVEPTRTSVSVAAYRYTSRNYLSFNDAAMFNDRLRSGSSDWLGYDRRPRNRLQLSLGQPLGGSWGSLSLSAMSQDYWNNTARNTNYQAGYSRSFSWGSFNSHISRMAAGDGAYFNQYYMGLHFPLGKGAYRPSMSTSVSYSEQSKTTDVQTSLSGTYGERGQLSYSVFGTHARSSGNAPTSTSGGGGLQYSASQGTARASYSTGNRYSQNSLGASGSVVVHGGGVTLGQTLGDTAALIEAEGAAGARVSSATGVSVDRFGYAVVPYLSPFRNNTVTLDAQGSSSNVEINDNRKLVVPTSGALALVKFETDIGRPVLFTVKQDDGKAPPFGAYIEDGQGKVLGQAGQGGRIFIRAPANEGFVIVAWGENSQKRCRIDYQLPPAKDDNDYLLLEAPCRHLAESQPTSP